MKNHVVGNMSKPNSIDHKCAGARDGNVGYTVAPSEVWFQVFLLQFSPGSCFSGCQAKRT